MIFFFFITLDEKGSNPQTLLFSATMPPWVADTARRYMREDWKKVDLVGTDRVKTNKNVQVRMLGATASSLHHT